MLAALHRPHRLRRRSTSLYSPAGAVDRRSLAHLGMGVQEATTLADSLMLNSTLQSLDVSVDGYEQAEEAAGGAEEQQASDSEGEGGPGDANAARLAVVRRRQEHKSRFRRNLKDPELPAPQHAAALLESDTESDGGMRLQERVAMAAAAAKQRVRMGPLGMGSLGEGLKLNASLTYLKCVRHARRRSMRPHPRPTAQPVWACIWAPRLHSADRGSAAQRRAAQITGGAAVRCAVRLVRCAHR